MQEQLPMPCFAGGTGSPFQQTPIKPSERRKQAASGRLFFGYFLLAKQKKVSRPPVRELALKQSVALATHYCVHPSTSSGRTGFYKSSRMHSMHQTIILILVRKTHPTNINLSRIQ